MDPLISASELAGLRSVAESAMQTDVAIYERSTVKGDNGQTNVWTYARTVKGMLFNQLTPAITLVSGEAGTVTSIALRLPVGTPINPGDKALIDSRYYLVSDTAPDDTWSAMLRCSLRIVE